MAGLSVDGLISGLSTSALIDQLIAAEAVPQSLLKSKQSQTSSLVSALQALNTRVASLAEAAAKAAKPESWDAAKATSSSTDVTTSVASASAAQAGEVSFRVDAAATSQAVVTRGAFGLAENVLAGQPPVLTLTRGDTTVTIEPASGSLQDVVAAINQNPEAGVRATLVRGVTADGAVGYRLQLTGTQTGEQDGAFSVSGLVADESAELQTIRTASDARITLYAGSGAEQVMTSSTNTFEGLLSGVDVTVSAAAVGEDVTVSVARDDAALKSLASGLVGSLGVVLSEISSRTATTTTTAADGRTVVTGGLFSGDSTVRGLQQQLQSAMSFPVDGVSPSTVGLVINRDGTFTFDETKFAEALAADPAKVQKVVAGVAQRVADVAEAASDRYDGTLTTKITGQESIVKSLGDQIDAWDRRLALRRESLVRTYTQLETQLSRLQSQSAFLMSQLGVNNQNSN
ncbi:acyl-CoA desaturase [Xylanimonas oleitrophica]|uniref:Flagellar hook-associated protein 2 n=1 Tax=Xylanimonas oleitrophica TaxID=2607479 RepID=A0A2W5YH02_9MICO|nr:flagellar filament capping protein FliD [Xylanimonas oleitrophica]PZR54121.1 acyl-CoA desaturase [Xylanimonas oleitrophica]